MQTIRKLWRFAHPYRWRFLQALILTVFFTFASMSPPLLMSMLLDRVIKPEAWHLLAAITGAMLLSRLGITILRFFNARTIMSVSNRIISDIRRALYRHVMQLDMQFHTEHASGAVIGRIMEDVNQIQRLFQAESFRILMDSIILIGATTYLFIVKWELAVISIVTIGAYILIYRFFSRGIHRATRAYRELYDQISARLQETVEGVRLVRIFNREDWENQEFLRRTAQSLDKRMLSRMNIVALSAGCQTVAGLGSVIVAGAGAWYVLQQRLTIGELQATIAYMWMALQPAMRITQIAGQLIETLVSANRILELFDAKITITSAEGAPRLSMVEGRVDFKDVSFSYVASAPLFKNLNLSVAPGQMIALVGHTGSGKTSIVSLLMRYWDVLDGSIAIDNSDIRSVDLLSLRQQFGVVPQHPVIFEGTIANNIAYGATHASREEIERAATMAEIHATIARLPDTYDTVVGTQGIKLSVGEKQRINIARAILRDPRILILDEATSALDSESESLIQQAMKKILKGRTSIVIAHRLSTVTNADRIIVLDHGKIIQSGTHESLLEETGGIYHTLYEEMVRQSKETGI